MSGSIAIQDIPARVGEEVGLSDWRPVTQEMIDAFAQATDDDQWIHTDPERATAEGPFGGTIAHGFLTLSILSTLAYEALPVLQHQTLSINYGFDKIRFAAPVRSGARVRARFKLTDADVRKSGRVLFTYDVKVEIEGSIRPAFSAQWLVLSVVDTEAAGL
jgi:acyl dehydratase